MSHYLYHWVPQEMTGDTLYPLNTLKEVYPEAYTTHAKKYEGREKVMDFRIPTLDCFWNDVLHFSAVPPEKIKEALDEASGKSTKPMRYYVVDPKLLDPAKTTVFYQEVFGPDMMSEKNFSVFDQNNMEKYSTLPQETKDYYKETFAEGKRPQTFHRVVHILYKGSINIKGLPVVEI